MSRVTRNIRKTLNAVDEMCGFIIACALVKPDKSLSSVEPSTVRKKMKTRLSRARAP